jgi:hypothetical protein
MSFSRNRLGNLSYLRPSFEVDRATMPPCRGALKRDYVLLIPNVISGDGRTNKPAAARISRSATESIESRDGVRDGVRDGGDMGG